MAEMLKYFGYSLTWITLLIAVLILVTVLRNGKGGIRDDAALWIGVVTMLFGLVLLHNFQATYSAIAMQIQRAMQQQQLQEQSAPRPVPQSTQ